MKDYETFKCKKSSRDDLMAAFSDLFNSINYKVALFLFILGIFIFSDLFVDGVLMSFRDAVYTDVPTTKGTTIQLMFLTIGYVLIDLLVTGNVI
jgi:hypothetical protein